MDNAGYEIRASSKNYTEEIRMSEKWDKEALIDYVNSLIMDLDDCDYSLWESKGNDFLVIRIERG